MQPSQGQSPRDVVLLQQTMRGWLAKRESVLQINPSASLIRFMFVYTRVYMSVNLYDLGRTEGLQALTHPSRVFLKATG